MCNVASIATGALGVGASAASYAASSQAANEQAKAENARYRATSAAAIASYNRGFRQLAIRGQQERAASLDAGLASALDAQAARGSARARAGAAGITGGNTFDQVIGDFDRIEASTSVNRNINLSQTQRALADEAVNLWAQTQSNINSAMPNRYQSPSLLPFLSGSASSVIGAVDMGQRQTRTGPYNPDPTRVGSSWLYRPLFG